jgi:hypothetical protein
MTYGAAFATYTNISSIGTPIDTGGFALNTVNPINVKATVRETLVFCVSKSAPAAGCTSLTTPNLVLGHGSPLALDYGQQDTDTAVSQISTNAASGATVNMKIDNACGGLSRDGGTTCNIAPQGGTAAADLAGTGKVGFKVSTPGSGVSPTSGTTVAASPYNTANYALNWVSGNATGIGSTYGDQVFTTSGAPAANMNNTITFSASASTATPAGSYSANFYLNAVGTF